MKDLYKKHSIIDESYLYFNKWLPQGEEKSIGKVIKIGIWSESSVSRTAIKLSRLYREAFTVNVLQCGVS